MAEQNEKELLKAIGLAVAVVILAVISALVIGSILGSSVFDDVPVTGTNTNESLGLVNNVSNTTMDIISTNPTATCTLVDVNNFTSGEVLLASNYTFFPADCNIILTATSVYNQSLLNATYGFSFASGTSLAGVNVTAISDNFGEFVTGLLGFLGIIGIVLGVIWLILYVARLFSKGGLNDLGATA